MDLSDPLDLPRTLWPLQRGRGDPALRVDPGQHRGGPAGTPGAGAWMCFRVYRRHNDGAHSPPSSLAAFEGAQPAAPLQETGVVTLRLDQLSASAVRVRAVGTTPAAAEEGLRRAPAILGAEDDWTEFELLLDAMEDEASLALARIRRHHPGVRLTATGQLFDQLITVALEQKVTHDQARHGWRQLLNRHGERPPSSSALIAPEWMRLPLNGGQLRAVPSWEWHRMWVQPPLAATVQRIAGRAQALHRLAEAPRETHAVAELAERLTALPGVGEWTAAEALQRSHGAADLPAVGDWHLPHLVGEALSGVRTDDAGMLELLAPWQGHRQRVIRLIRLSGYRHQRFGPMLAPEDHRQR